MCEHYRHTVGRLKTTKVLKEKVKSKYIFIKNARENTWLARADGTAYRVLSEKILDLDLLSMYESEWEKHSCGAGVFIVLSKLNRVNHAPKTMEQLNKQEENEQEQIKHKQKFKQRRKKKGIIVETTNDDENLLKLRRNIQENKTRQVVDDLNQRTNILPKNLELAELKPIVEAQSLGGQFKKYLNCDRKEKKKLRKKFESAKPDLQQEILHSLKNSIGIKFTVNLLKRTAVEDWLNEATKAQVIADIVENSSEDIQKRFYDVTKQFTSRSEFWGFTLKTLRKYHLLIPEYCDIVEFLDEGTDFNQLITEAQNEDWFVNVKVSWVQQLTSLNTFDAKVLACLPWSRSALEAMYEKFKKEIITPESLRLLKQLHSISIEESSVYDAIYKSRNVPQFVRRIHMKLLKGYVATIQEFENYSLGNDSLVMILEQYVSENTSSSRLRSIKHVLKFLTENLHKMKINHRYKPVETLLHMIIEYDLNEQEIKSIFHNQSLVDDEIIDFDDYLIEIIYEKHILKKRFSQTKIEKDKVHDIGVEIFRNSDDVKTLGLHHKKLEEVRKNNRNSQNNEEDEISEVEDKRYILIVKILDAMRDTFPIKKGYSERVVQVVILLYLVFFKTESSKGLLAQVYTGEGKTSIVAMFAAYKVLEHVRSRNEKTEVDIITSSIELSSPQLEENLPFYEKLGIRAGIVDKQSSIYQQQRDHNECLKDFDILYGTVSSYIHEILNDQIEIDRHFKYNRTKRVAIVDEVDNMLIDRSSALVQISSSEGAYLMPLLTPILLEIYKAVPEGFKDYTSSLTSSNTGSKESMYEHIKKYCKFILNEKRATKTLPSFLKDHTDFQFEVWVENALNAILYYQDGIEYIVDKEHGRNIKIDSNNTGVLQKSTHLSNGVQQFLSMKQNVAIPLINLTSTFCGLVQYFRGYPEIYGLSGTLGSNETQDFLQDVYDVNLVRFPSHFQSRVLTMRKNSPYRCLELRPLVLNNTSDWVEAIRDSVRRQMRLDRATLVICENLMICNTLFEHIREDCKAYDGNEVYKYDAVSENKVNELGSQDVLVATNIAGRGTDLSIVNGAEELGGLHVCLTYLPESERVELQNVGRTARKGNMGTAQLIINTGHNRDISLNQLKKNRETKIVENLIVGRKEVQDLEFATELSNEFESALTKKYKNVFKNVDWQCLKELEHSWYNSAHYKDAIQRYQDIDQNDVTKAELLAGAKKKYLAWKQKRGAYVRKNSVEKLFLMSNTTTSIELSPSQSPSKLCLSNIQLNYCRQLWSFWLKKNWFGSTKKDIDKTRESIQNFVRENVNSNNLIVQNPVFFVKEIFDIISLSKTVHKADDNLKIVLEELHGTKKEIFRSCYKESFNDFACFLYYFEAYWYWTLLDREANNYDKMLRHIKLLLEKSKNLLQATFLSLYTELLCLVVPDNEELSNHFSALQIQLSQFIGNINNSLNCIEKLLESDSLQPGETNIARIEDLGGGVVEDRKEETKFIVLQNLYAIGLFGVFFIQSREYNKQKGCLDYLVDIGKFIWNTVKLVVKTVCHVVMYTATLAVKIIGFVAAKVSSFIEQLTTNSLFLELLSKGVQFVTKGLSEVANSVVNHMENFTERFISGESTYREMMIQTLPNKFKDLLRSGAFIQDPKNNDAEFEESVRQYFKHTEKIKPKLTSLRTLYYELLKKAFSDKKNLFKSAMKLDYFDGAPLLSNKILFKLKEKTIRKKRIVNLVKNIFRKNKKHYINIDDTMVHKEVHIFVENIVARTKNICDKSNEIYINRVSELSEIYDLENDPNIERAWQTNYNKLVYSIIKPYLDAKMSAAKVEIEKIHGIPVLRTKYLEYNEKIRGELDVFCKKQELNNFNTAGECICCSKVSTRTLLKEVATKFNIIISHYNKNYMLTEVFKPCKLNLVRGHIQVHRDFIKSSKWKILNDRSQNTPCCLLLYLGNKYKLGKIKLILSKNEEEFLETSYRFKFSDKELNEKLQNEAILKLMLEGFKNKRHCARPTDLALVFNNKLPLKGYNVKLYHVKVRDKRFELRQIDNLKQKDIPFTDIQNGKYLEEAVDNASEV